MYPQTVDCIVGIGAGALKKDIFIIALILRRYQKHFDNRLGKEYL